MATYKELLQQQEALALKIEEARKLELADAVAKARALVNEYGLTAQDVFPSGRRGAGKAAGTGAKVAPKYRDQATGQTWTGRGKAPKWIDGQDRTRFLIASRAIGRSARGRFFHGPNAWQAWRMPRLLPARQQPLDEDGIIPALHGRNQTDGPKYPAAH